MAVVMRGAFHCHLLVQLVVGISNSMTGENLGDQYWVSGSDVTANWTEAETACAERKGHLFYATPSVSMGSVTDRLESENVYWVGARVVTQSWIWDRTREHLYRNIGYAAANLVSSTEVRSYHGQHDNQAFTCFVHCFTPYIALQQTKCVCLGNKPPVANLSTVQLVPCPGNEKEHCGNTTGYNIYYDRLSSMGKFRAPRNNSYLFKYAYLVKSEDGKISISSSNNSSERRASLCDTVRSTGQGNRLTGDGRFSLIEADGDCRNRKTTLLQVTEDTDFDIPAGQYWIGLRRQTSWKWINGTVMSRSPKSSLNGYQCVGVVKTSTVMTANYRCSDKKRYVCVTPQVKKLGKSSIPQGTPSSKTGSPVDWRVWLGVGLVGSVLVICLVAALFVLLLRYRKSHTTCGRCDETGKSKLSPINIESSISVLESEYSDVRDIITPTTPPPDVIAEEGLYSEPCKESGNFTGKIHPQIYVNVSSSSEHRNADTGTNCSTQIPGEDDQVVQNTGAQYAIPKQNATSAWEDPEDPGYNVPRVDGVPGVTDSKDVINTSLTSADSQYNIPRSGCHSDPSAIGHTLSAGKAATPANNKVLINTKWEPGRYDVPRSNENMDSITRIWSGGSGKTGCLTGHQSSGSAKYITPLTVDQIYAIPKN